MSDSVNMISRNFPPAAVGETISEGPELGAAEVMLDEEDSGSQQASLPGTP